MATETTGLAVIEDKNALSTPSEPEVDNGNWGDDDEGSRPQFIAIKQALTEGQDHLPNGTLFCKSSGQTWNEIKMVVLRMGHTREWKPSSPKFVADEKPLCKSRDGKFPILDDDRLVPQAKDCASCSKASWDGYDRKAKTGVKPTCNKGFHFLFLDEETQLPYIYNASGQSVDPAKELYDAMKSRAKLVRAKTGRMPNTYEFVVTMTAEKGNKAFKAKFTTLREMKADDAAKYGPLFEQFVTAFQNSKRKSDSEDGDVEEGEYVAADTGAVDDDEVVAV